MVSELTLYSDNPSSYPAEAFSFTLKVMLEKRRNKQKETGTGPFKRRGRVLIFEAQ